MLLIIAISLIQWIVIYRIFQSTDKSFLFLQKKKEKKRNNCYLLLYLMRIIEIVHMQAQKITVITVCLRASSEIPLTNMPKSMKTAQAIAVPTIIFLNSFLSMFILQKTGHNSSRRVKPFSNSLINSSINSLQSSDVLIGLLVPNKY